MKSIFETTEEEKNRIRGLHLTESKDKRITSTINESPESLYEEMAATNIDLEATAEAFDEAEGEENENWDDLDDNIKDTLRQHKEFKNMEEDAIREKFNAMDPTSICKIFRFAVGWIWKILRAPATAFTKSIRKGPMADSSYGRRRAWRCR